MDYKEGNLLEMINLRPLTMNDFETIVKWSRDDSFCSANGWEFNRNHEELHKWWFNCVTRVAEDFIRMGIVYSTRLVGYVDLACIKDNTAELGIAIGESGLWGKGIGFNSCINMMYFASRELGITIFNTETHEANIRSRMLLEKLGFKEISRLGSEEYLGLDSQLIQYKLELQR